MRLRKVKMAGFKSFVDPTTLSFPSDMVGIVGPNGCGKSNIVDAIRWVMGASTKHIRGDNIEDVIFKGSSGRQPVGQASIELVFDNSSNKIGGKYASYDEISIRRQIARDGQSKYYLNGTHCRRRDVVDIFLGTGLGPRSYAIIEQGMISRLIDAKPEEMRVYLEEAAGISKYKERRRETENRINHTRENLDRLNDVIEEVAKQITKLKRQATIAEKYKSLKTEERRTKAELLLLRWQSMQKELAQEERHVENQETQLEQTIAGLRTLEAGLEQLRVDQTAANEATNEVQAQYYQVGADISRAEQTIHHAKETQQRHINDLDQTDNDLQNVEVEIEKQQGVHAEYDTQMQLMQEQLTGLHNEFAEAGEAVATAEQAESTWREAWDDLNIEISEPMHQVEVQSQRVEMLENEIERLQQRSEKFSREHAQLLAEDYQEDLSPLEETLDQKEQAVTDCKATLDHIATSISESRQQVEDFGSEFEDRRAERQQIQAELVTLQALQDAALHSKQEDVQSWLSQRNLKDASRLADVIEVEAGWERAVETVLEDYLQAVCATDLENLSQHFSTLAGGELVFADTANSQAIEASPHTLASKVQGDVAIISQLQHVFIAKDIKQAFTLREQLLPHESVVTPDGIWLSATWMRYAKSVDTQAGVLSRKATMADLQAQDQRLEEALSDITSQRQTELDKLKDLEIAREEAQHNYQEVFREHAELKAELEQKRAQINHWLQRDSQLRTLIEDSSGQLTDYQMQRDAAIEKSETAQTRLAALQTKKDELYQRKEDVQFEFNECKEQATLLQERRHALQLELEASRTRNATAQSIIERLRAQKQELGQRKIDLAKLVQENEQPLSEMADELQTLLDSQVGIEQKLNDARKSLEQVDFNIREKEQERTQVDAQITNQRDELNALRMRWQELNVRVQTIKEDLDKYDASVEELTEGMPEEASLERWEELVQELEVKINRLGAINLAAIDEHEEQSKRKEYLDSQHEDLTKALTTLENAIRKIDKETRERFKDTFDRVNSHIQSMYPRLFPGGKAYLQMSGDDLLTTGVTIMARPPGKKVSSIQLLSGGEKALTAAALVLAIFELNPAPFCLLDEVDAPLDDANVGRFCDLIKDMSKRVQFAFITHNKTTMEYADHLLGVTMNEPGVSKLVSVDIEEASELATAG